jgi:hypothetical protein
MPYKNITISLLILLGLLFVAWVISGSQSFKTCFRNNENAQTYSALQEDINVVTKAVIRIRLNSECALHFFGDDSAAITALSTLLIAAFTWTLWLSTRRQWRLTQRTICLARAEFNATHRPHLIVRDISVVGDNIVFLLINKGDAPAVLVESWLLVESPTEGQAIRPMRSEGHNNLGNISFAVGEIREITWPLGEFTMSIKYGAGIPIKRGDMTEYDHRGAIHFAMTIVYADSERQHRRRSVFRRKWDRERKGFCRLNDPDQEYTD